MIEIRAIRAHGKHGASEVERREAQPFDVDVRIEIDLSMPADTDSLEQTINYATLHARLVSTVEQRSFHLIERLAAELLSVIFEDVRVACAEVVVAKPSILDGATPAVRLNRANPRYLAACP